MTAIPLIALGMPLKTAPTGLGAIRIDALRIAADADLRRLALG